MSSDVAGFLAPVGGGSTSPGGHVSVASPDTQRIDVIVATRNRPEDLARLLPSLVLQTIDDFRCLIIDQSDDPGPNLRLVADMADERLCHVRQSEKGKSKALNLGLTLTTADIVAFTDDDCVVPATWLEDVLGAVRAPAPAPIGIVFGNVIPAIHDPVTTFIPSISFDRDHVIVGRPLAPIGLIGMGANMAARRSVFDVIGGFDEDLGPGGQLETGEDCEVAYRALAHGFVVTQRRTISLIHWGARPVADGVARDMVTTGWFAIGAGYGKHLRTGDWRALVILVLEMVSSVGATIVAVIRRRGPFHLRRLGRMLAGAVRGFRRGPNIGVVTPQTPK